MKRLALLAALALALVTAPGPSPYRCTSDADCSARGVVTCAVCPDYTEALP